MNRERTASVALVLAAIGSIVFAATGLIGVTALRDASQSTWNTQLAVLAASLGGAAAFLGLAGVTARRPQFKQLGRVAVLFFGAAVIVGLLVIRAYDDRATCRIATQAVDACIVDTPTVTSLR